MRFDLECHINIITYPFLIKEWVFRLNIDFGISKDLFVLPIIINPQLLILLFILLEHFHLILIPPLQLPELPLPDLLDLLVIELVLLALVLIHLRLQI